MYTNYYLYIIIQRNNTSRRSTQTRLCYIEAYSLSRVRSRETVPKEQDKKKQGNFYWEGRLCLLWKLYKESITMLLLSLVHQFIWPTFTLVLTRNGIFKYNQKPWMWLKSTMTSNFIMSDRAAFSGTFRMEANQTSKVELYTRKIASEQLKTSSCETFSHKVPSSMLDCNHTMRTTTQSGFSITYL